MAGAGVGCLSERPNATSEFETSEVFCLDASVLQLGPFELSAIRKNSIPEMLLEPLARVAMCAKHALLPDSGPFISPLGATTFMSVSLVYCSFWPNSEKHGEMNYSFG